jgi:hypothetical protein
MAKEKVYFSELEEDYANPLDYIIDMMKDEGLDKIEVALAERDLKSNYIYCKAIDDSMDKTLEDCGKKCEDYEPRNGKFGCCKHRGYTYSPGKEFILTRDGKLTASTSSATELKPI